jgi:hypothetical protein
MFAHNFKENLTNVVEIRDIKLEVFQELLRFIYCGKVNDLNKHAAGLYRAADKVGYNMQ